jgi:hypothetical protein
MRCRYRNKDYRAHFMLHRRRMLEPQHDYDAHRPIIANSDRTHGVRMRTEELIRYAAALGRSRGVLPENLREHYAFGLRRNDGTGYVDFTPGHSVNTAYGPELRPDRDATPIRIDVRNLDWQPEPPTEELLDQDVEYV